MYFVLINNIAVKFNDLLEKHTLKGFSIEIIVV